MILVYMTRIFTYVIYIQYTKLKNNKMHLKVIKAINKMLYKIIKN